MNRNNILSKCSILFFTIISFYSCNDEILEVENTNDPLESVSSADDAIATAEALYHSFYDVTHDIEDVNNPSLALWTMSDVGTCSWGNYGMRDMSSEPRQVFDNSPTYSNGAINSNYWKGLYSVITKANTVLRSLEKYELDENEEMVKALTYFNRGLAYGYLGLVYDKAYVVDETINLANQEEIIATERDYKGMIEKALSDLDKAITISNSATFTTNDGTISGITLDNQMLSKLANSYAARITVLSSRNQTENNSVDWNKVLNYASNGITDDLMIDIEIDTKWDDTFKLYATYPGWGRIDMRIINMLDNNMPARWPDSGYDALPDNGVATSNDARLNLDFQYLGSNNFRPERGLYHYSSYRYARWDDTVLSFQATTVPEFWKSENDLMIAEAMHMTGNIAGAVSQVNEGTRISRGNLPPTDAASIANDIFYERQIELILSTFGLEYFDMRRYNKLQSGTPLHFPVPGDQLQLILESIYSFGGSTGSAGGDYSTGGWE